VSPDPVPVARAIAALLGATPDPDATPTALAAWLTAKADLLDRIATAAADPDLAHRAKACAADARTATTPTTFPVGSTEGDQP
jgi:hypothetical protein